MQDHQFNLSYSRFYFLYLLVLSLTSMVALTVLNVSMMIKLLISLVIVSYFISRFRALIFFQAKTSIRSLRVQQGGVWILAMNDGVERAQLLGESVVTPFVSILLFKMAKQKLPKACVVFYDALTPEQYNRLCVACRTTRWKKIHY
ncbi:MAG: hypothetical protein H0W64_01825 [Gammaproteobacteria bacterium]|nr:hypothetical protein [Gammaproteobacteria bacterium]